MWVQRHTPDGLPMLLAAPDDGTGAGGTGEPPSGDGAGATGVQSGQDTGSTADGGSGTTQPDIDRIISDRLNRDRTTRAKEAGFDSHDDLVNAAKAGKQAEEAAKSELQKATDRATSAESRAAELEKTLRDRDMREAVMAAARAANAIDADAVTMLAIADGGIAVDDDGAISGVEDTVRKILAGKPHLVAGTGVGAGGSGIDAGFQGGQATDLQSRIAKAEADGDWGTALALKTQLASTNT